LPLIIIFFLLIAYYLSFNYLFSNYVSDVGKPIEIGYVKGEQHEMLFYVDSFGITRFEGQETYQIVGWVFPKDLSQDLLNYHKQVILVNDHNLVYSYNTETMNRIDVTRNYKDLGINLDQSGFTVYISKYSLPQGKYKVGFRFISDDGKDNMIYIPEIFIVRTANTLLFSKQ
jgi:hypothetical protein